MKLNNLTASAFAESIGVQPSSVSHILSGRNKPSLEFIQKIINKYPRIDPSWLINGTTSVQLTKSDAIKEETKPEEKTVSVNPKKEIEKDLPSNQEKKIDKILVFYLDGTFMEFNPSS